MSYWVKHEDDSYMPDWLKSSLSSKCNYCGSSMENYYNDDYRCTNRRCTNPECYGFVAAKADFARKLLKIEGVGFAGCLKDAILSKSKTPFELFHAWGMKPLVTLEQFLRIHCFEGVDSEWEKITKQLNIYTLDELFEKYDGKWKGLLEDNKDLLYHNVQYVKLQERPYAESANTPRVVYTVMITGTPIGYENKEHFINTINAICKGKIVLIHQKTKKQSGVHFLIREPGSTTRGKVEAALKGNIPIVTSEQFIQILVAKMQELNSEV